MRKNEIRERERDRERERQREREREREREKEKESEDGWRRTKRERRELQSNDSDIQGILRDRGARG